jgi:two-component system, OmpR family, sensor kinase
LWQWPRPAPAGLPTATFGVVIYDNGTRQSLTRRFDQSTPDLRSLSKEVILAHNNQPFTVGSVQSDASWRIVARPVTDPFRGPGTLVIGQSLTDVGDTIAQMAVALLAIGLVVLAAVGGGGWLMVRRALRPLREVEAVAGAIAGGDLSRRVPSRPPSTEVGRLSASLNSMLAQVEQAFAVQSASEERMRRFVSDASHELRTPLAAVRGYAELYRQGAVSQPDDIRAAMARIENESTRMGVLVEDLLTLARMDEQRPERRTLVDLTVLAADAVLDARAMAPEREVTVSGRGQPIVPTVVLGDESRLRQVVSNLVANALRHTPAGSPIELCVGPAPATPTEAAVGILEVRDHGPGVPPDQVRQVFERFFRADESRQRASGGTGLGLAIVAAIVASHNGQVGITATIGGGATFAVRLPLANSQVPLRTDSPGEVLISQEPVAPALTHSPNPQS